MIAIRRLVTRLFGRHRPAQIEAAHIRDAALRARIAAWSEERRA